MGSVGLHSRAFGTRLMELTSVVIERLGAYRKLSVVGIHVVLVSLSYFLAFLLRFDFRLPREEWMLFLWTLPLLVGVRIGVFAGFHLHKGLWRYVSMPDVI